MTMQDINKPRIRVPARVNGHLSQEEISIHAISGALERMYQDRAAPRGEIALADPMRLFPGEQFTQYNPSALVSRKGLRIFDAMRQDDQVKAAMLTKKLAVTISGWEIVSPDEQDADWEPTRFIETQLNELEGTLDQNILEIMTALDFGYSVTEKVFADIEDGEFSGKIGLEALRTKKPHSFDLVTDEYGKLLPNGIRQEQPKADQGRRSMPRSKFVVMTYRPEFGNPYGHSDLEEVYRPWWAKNNAYKWLIMYLERFGIPPMFALYNPGAFRGQQLEQLKTVIQRLQAATSGMIPRASKDDLEMWAPEIAGQVARVFMPALDMYDKHIARGILMPGLLGMTPDAQQGSFARSRVSFDVFMMVVEFLRNYMAEAVMNEQIIRPLVDLNYPVDEYPEFRWLPLTDEFRADVLDSWTKLLQGGAVQQRPGDEAHIRQITEFPESDPDAMPEAPEPEPEPEPEGGGEPDDDDDEPSEGGDGIDIGEPVRRQSRFAAGTRRRKTKAERAVNFAQIEETLDDLEADAVRRIRPVLSEARDKLVRKLRRSGNSQSLIDGLTVNTKNKVRPILSDLFDAAFRKGRTEVRREIRQSAAKAKAAEMQGEPTFIPKDAIEFLEAKATTASGVLDPRLRAELQNALSTALKIGEPVRDTMERIKAVWEPYIGDPSKIRNGRPVTPARLETIVRTNLTEAINDGRLVGMRDPDLDEFVAGVQYSAIIDSRTTEVCQHLDEKIFRKDSSELTRLSPPNHFNCRSLLVPVTIDVGVDDNDFATAGQIGRGVELSGKGFV